ncbi:unnamed protein product [Phaeothamnion confervicola]
MISDWCKYKRPQSLLFHHVSYLSQAAHSLPPDDLLRQLGTSLQSGLSREESRKRRAMGGINVVPPPHHCPAWICCLLPCIMRGGTMRRWAAVIPDDAEVRRGNAWLRLDAPSIVCGDIIHLSPGDIAAADIRLLNLERGEFVVRSLEDTMEQGTGSMRLSRIKLSRYSSSFPIPTCSSTRAR